MFNFVSLLKYKRQMTGNKLCVNLLRCAAQVFTTPLLNNFTAGSTVGWTEMCLIKQFYGTC